MSISFSRVLSSLFRRMSLFSAALSFTGLVFLAQPASAQQSQRAREADHPAPAQTAAAIKSLSTQSQVVIARLAKLGEVRIGNWKYHFGELPNGQSPALDDSSWPEIHGRVNPSGDNWLRKWVEIPASVAGYDLTGCRVMVSLMVHAYGGEGATIFIDGKPIAQINHSEPVVAYYKPGRPRTADRQVRKDSDGLESAQRVYANSIQLRPPKPVGPLHRVHYGDAAHSGPLAECSSRPGHAEQGH